MESKPVSHTSGSGICSLLALPGQAMAQVSDTWGLESHARKLYTLGPQVAASSCCKQTGLPKEEAGSPEPTGRGTTSGGKAAAQERTQPLTRVRGGKATGRWKVSWAKSTELGQAGVNASRKGS